MLELYQLPLMQDEGKSSKLGVNFAVGSIHILSGQLNEIIAIYTLFLTINLT